MMMRNRLLTIILLLGSYLAAVAQVGDLPRSTPEAEGVNPRLISNLYHLLDSHPTIDVHHAMILRHGKVISEVHASPYRPTDKHILNSASKTVTGLAVGLAVQDKLLSIDDDVSKHLRDKMPAKLTPALDSLKVRHLLMMAAGRTEDLSIFMGQDDWLTEWFKGDFHGVGKKFHYDSMVTHALAMIVSRVTGKSLLEYVQERIFTPLHITDADWELAPDSVEIAGWGLRLHTESEAKLGQLMLQDGKWNGQQVVSKQWIHDMIKRQINTSDDIQPELSIVDQVKRWFVKTWNLIISWFTGYNNSAYYAGYGYQVKTILKPYAEAFFACGYGGQLIYVVPKCDLVIVLNGRASDYGDELNAFYDYLVVPLLSGELPQPLYSCDTMTVDMPHGEATHLLEKRLLGRPIVLDENPLGINTIEVTREGDNRLFTMTDFRGSLEIHAACGQWLYTTGDGRPIYIMDHREQFIGTHRPFTSVAAYGWQGDTLAMRVDWLDGGDNRRLWMTLDGERVTVAVSDGYDPKLTDTISGLLQ